MQVRARRHSEFRLQGGSIHADVDVSVVAHAGDTVTHGMSRPEETEGVVVVGEVELGVADWPTEQDALLAQQTGDAFGVLSEVELKTMCYVRWL